MGKHLRNGRILPLTAAVCAGSTLVATGLAGPILAGPALANPAFAGTALAGTAARGRAPVAAAGARTASAAPGDRTTGRTVTNAAAATDTASPVNAARGAGTNAAPGALPGVATDAGAATAPDRGVRGRGELLAAPVHLQGLSTEQTAAALRQAGFSADAVRNGVDTYRLVYRTVDPNGRPTSASGLLVVPRTATPRPRLVSFAHGTESYKADAPSMGDDFPASPAVTFGAEGFAAVAPDYLGLGVGPGAHPWMDVPSETTASLDMLRAARAYLTELGRPPAPSVLVTGFSQGASAALGLARAIQGGADPGFRLGAVAPISGAYDIRGAELPEMLDGTRIPGRMAAVYTTYLLVAWNRLHHLYASPKEVFKKPYAAKADHLFDGTTPGQDMFNALPDGLRPLLTRRGFALLRHPTPRFAAALAVADGTCTGWVPGVPVRLYDAPGDEQAVDQNTDRCRAAFRASGADVPVVTLPAEDYQESRHLGSAVSGTAAIAGWFARLGT